MPECDNCGSFVTAKYRRHYEIDGELHACPHCDDATRGRDSRARAARSNRQAHRGAKPRYELLEGDD